MINQTNLIEFSGKYFEKKTKEAFKHGGFHMQSNRDTIISVDIKGLRGCPNGFVVLIFGNKSRD